MNYRRISIATFVAGLVLLPVSLVFLIRAVAGPRINSLAMSWTIGRALGIAAAILLGASIVTAFLTPPDRARRVWWAVPATVVLLVALLFGWFLF
jgi:uncharacterized membrane protein